MYDFETMVERFYRHNLSNGDVCVDVGAHMGRHTFRMAEAVAPSGLILAFEPIPTIRERLYANVAKQAEATGRYAQIAVHGCALSDRSGRSEFVVVKEWPEYSGLRERIYDSPVTREEIQVEVRTLDSFEADLPSLRYIKVDAEGGDYLVLRGAEILIRRCHPLISFECGDNGIVHYAHTAADIYDYLDSLDYRVSDIRGKQYSRDAFIQSSREQTIWDYVAAHESEKGILEAIVEYNFS